MFGRDEIFARIDASPAKIAQAERDGWSTGGFFTKLKVYVKTAIVSAEADTGVEVAQKAVAKCSVNGRQKLKRERVAAGVFKVRGGQRQRAVRKDLCRWHVDQAGRPIGRQCLRGTTGRHEWAAEHAQTTK